MIKLYLFIAFSLVTASYRKCSDVNQGINSRNLRVPLARVVKIVWLNVRQH